MFKKITAVLLVLISTCLSSSRPLLEAFPALQGVVPFVSLAELPTPIIESAQLEAALGAQTIFIKCDGLTGGNNGLYGGNKVRELEFLLGDAVRKEAQQIITFGCVGSTHCVATACYSNQCGLPCLVMLKPQINSPVVRQNLLLDYYFGAEFMFFANNDERWIELQKVLQERPGSYFIPTGGSTALGVIGYVNAAFELKQQIEAGILSEPDYIYLPIGSCGTTVGVLLGCQLAGIKSKIVAVAIEPEEYEDAFIKTVRQLFAETVALLHSYDATILVSDFPSEQLILTKEYTGTEYGQWLPEGDDATALMLQTTGIVLEGTYSAKAFAALVADVRGGKLSSRETVLFWDTYCGLDFSRILRQLDYRALDERVHGYFERKDE